MADPHSASRLGSENSKTLAKNNKEGQNEFIIPTPYTTIEISKRAPKLW